MRRGHIRHFFIFSFVLLDACALIFAFQSAYWIRFSLPSFIELFPITKGIPASGMYEQALTALLPMWLMIFGYAGLYRREPAGAYDEFVHVLKGVSLAALLTTTMSFAFRSVDFSRLVIGMWGVLAVVLVYALRETAKVLFRLLSHRVAGPHNVLVIGKGKAVEVLQEVAVHQPFLRTHFVDHPPATEQLERSLRDLKIAEVLLIQGSVSAPQILECARVCEHSSVECKVVPDLLEMRRGEIIFNGFCGLPTFHIKPLSLHGTNYLLKRSFDIVVSIILLAFIAIPLAFVALLIRLESRGPALFTQDRMGLRGRKFRVFKFRTMVQNADDYIEKLKALSDREGPVFKMKNDPRVTRVGAFLRKFSIDEMPQILNVLMGDMSLVGPRPQVLWEAAHYDDTAKKRLRVMPGITGLWQVSGRASLSYEQMINLDIYYLENWSLGLDLKILLRTLPAIFAREGAY